MREEISFDVSGDHNESTFFSAFFLSLKFLSLSYRAPTNVSAASRATRKRNGLIVTTSTVVHNYHDNPQQRVE